MQLNVNDKEFSFKFGIKFLKEINRKNRISANGMQVNAGVEGVATNLISGDLETLFDVLKIASQTEKNTFREKDFEAYVDENGSEDLFDEVFEELKKSEYTKKKFNEIVEKVEENKANNPT